jgi:hypothetical protein
MGIGLVNFIDNQENPVSYNTSPSYITILADPNSIEYYNDNSIDVYPNPATSNILIKSKIEDIISVKLLNYSGCEILNFTNLSDSFLNLDISNLKQGIYLAQIQTKKGLVLRKFSVYR